MRWVAALGLSLAITLSAVSATAEDQDTVTLKAGGSARGRIRVLVPNTRVDIELSPGKVMSFRWDEIDDVTRGLTGEGALGTIELRNGRLHGTITEIAVGDHVSIELPNGQTGTIPWTDVVRIDSGEHLKSAPKPSTRTPEPTTVVTIDAPSAVRLYRMSRYGNVDELCIAPCKEEVPSSGEFWVSGPDVNTSNHFTLSENASTRIVVSGGHKGTATAGMVMAGIGGGVILASGFVWLVGAAASSAPLQPPGDHSVRDVFTVAGVITGSGLLIGVAGLVLWLANTSSSADVQ